MSLTALAANPDLTCSVEFVVVMVRTHPAGGGFGDDYDVVMTLSGDEGVATLKGLTATTSLAHRRVVFAKLRELGFHTVRWTRHKHGKVREIRHSLIEENA